MQRSEQIRLIKGILAHLDAGTNVDAGGLRLNPTVTYVDPDLAHREWEEFFASRPQIIGLSGDLPDPGSFLTTDDLGFPLLATRSEDGSFHAFFNSCRHRGAVLIEEERGKTRRFACPFHAWSYASDGALAGLPKHDQFGLVDKGCFSLLELPALEWNGLLYVHPDPDGEIDPASQMPDELAAELENWNLESLTFLGTERWDIDCNWKLAMDTFGEAYHFPVLHKSTLDPVLHGNVQGYDRFGVNHRMMIVNREIDEMRERPEDEWDILSAASPVYWLFPNVQILVSQTALFLVRVIPAHQRPGAHVSHISYYQWPSEPGTPVLSNQAERFGLDPEYVEAAPFRAAAEAFASFLREEDYWMAESQQRAAESGRMTYTIFGRNEPALHHYHSTYRTLLGLEPLELLSEADVVAQLPNHPVAAPKP